MKPNVDEAGVKPRPIPYAKSYLLFSTGGYLALFTV